MPSKPTLKQFFSKFPTDDACLDQVMEVHYGMRHHFKACGVDVTFIC